MEYRNHEFGPLTKIEVIPGAVRISMEYDLPGCYTKLHSHTFDHWMECVAGSAIITIDGISTTVRKGDKYLVEAGKQHGVHPLEPGTMLLCIHEAEDISPDDNGTWPIEFLHRLTTPPDALEPIIVGTMDWKLDAE